MNAETSTLCSTPAHNGSSNGKLALPPSALETLGPALLDYLQSCDRWRELLFAEAVAQQKEIHAVAADISVMRRELATLRGIVEVGNAGSASGLEQLREQSDNLSRAFETMTVEVIARHVTDPLFAEFARVYESLSSIAEENALTAGTSVAGAMRQIVHFLESHGLTLLHPSAGDPFTPREHQPVGQVCANEEGLHHRIAATVTVGLVAGNRIIRPARVALFVFSPNFN